MKLNTANAMNIPKGKPTCGEIAAAAHSIREQEGRPEGRDVAHWLEAEMQIRQSRSPGVNT